MKLFAFRYYFLFFSWDFSTCLLYNISTILFFKMIRIFFSSNGDPHIGDDDEESDFVLQITDESQNRDYSLNFKRKHFLSNHWCSLMTIVVWQEIYFRLVTDYGAHFVNKSKTRQMSTRRLICEWFRSPDNGWIAKQRNFKRKHFSSYSQLEVQNLVKINFLIVN